MDCANLVVAPAAMVTDDDTESTGIPVLSQITVRRVLVAAAVPSLVTSVLIFTVDLEAVAPGVVIAVPQFLTWTGSVMVIHTCR